MATKMNRKILGFCALFAVWAFSAGSAWCWAFMSDDEDEKAKQAVEQTADLTAQEILSRAAKKQGGEEIAKNFKSFSADFETWYNHPDKGEVYFQVKRIFVFPCLIWTEKRHETQSKPTWEIYNGEDGWFVDEENETTIYTDKPSSYKTDIENLEEDVRVTRELFHNFFIANLRNEISDLERLSDKPFRPGGKPVHLVTGRRSTRYEGEREKTVYLNIFVDPEQDLVLAVRMIGLDERRVSRLFVFEKFLENKQGVIVPTRIVILRNDEPEPEMKIYINCEKDENDKIRPLLEFNVEHDPAIFMLPEE